MSPDTSVWVVDTSELAGRLHQQLLGRGETVACAESLTGGGLADLLSGTPGASADCASQMAAGVRTLMRTDWAVSTTGVAGPVKQDDKPVGTVYVGVAGPRGVQVHRLALAGDRREIRAAACRAAVEALLDELGR